MTLKTTRSHAPTLIRAFEWLRRENHVIATARADYLRGTRSSRSTGGR